MARRIGVAPDNIIYWRVHETSPHISVYPKIIAFLGYNPFPVDTSTLAGRIKRYRTEHGLSQEAFAILCGVDETSVRDWERGDRKPLPSKQRILEEILKPKELSQ